MENNEKELLERMESRLAAMDEQEKKRSRRGVVIAAATMVLMLGLAAFLWIKVSSFTSELRPVVNAVEALDMEAVTAKVNALAALDTEGLERLAGYLADMDETELKTRLDSMNDTLDMISRLDVASLSETMADLNKTLEPLLKLFGGRG